MAMNFIRAGIVTALIFGAVAFVAATAMNWPMKRDFARLLHG
jgi:hypothetical protein